MYLGIRSSAFCRKIKNGITATMSISLMLLLYFSIMNVSPFIIQNNNTHDNSITGGIPSVYAQFPFPGIIGSGEPQTDANNNETVTTPSSRDIVKSTSVYTLRGLIGNTISSTAPQSGGTVRQNNLGNSQVDYVMTGRWRMAVNQSLLQGFVANTTLVKIDGSQSQNILIRNMGHGFNISGDSANIVVRQMPISISVNDNIFDNTSHATVQLLSNSVIKIVVNVDKSTPPVESEDVILRVIDGRAFYGTLESRE